MQIRADSTVASTWSRKPPHFQCEKPGLWTPLALLSLGTFLLLALAAQPASGQAAITDGTLGATAATGGSTGVPRGNWAMGTGGSYDPAVGPGTPPNLRPWSGGYYNLPASPYYGSSYWTILATSSATAYYSGLGPGYGDPTGYTKRPMGYTNYIGTSIDSPTSFHSTWQTGQSATLTNPDNLVVTERVTIAADPAIGSFVHHELEVCNQGANPVSFRLRAAHFVRVDATDISPKAWVGHDWSEPPGNIIWEQQSPVTSLGLHFTTPASSLDYYALLDQPTGVTLPTSVDTPDRVVYGEYDRMWFWQVPVWTAWGGGVGADLIDTSGLYYFWGEATPYSLAPWNPPALPSCTSVHSYFGPKPLLGAAAPIAEFTTAALAEDCPTPSWTFTFNDASTDADSAVTTWAWDFGDSTTATGPNVSHSYESPGVYIVTLTVTDPTGLTSTKAVAIESPELPQCPPTADFAIVLTHSGCPIPQWTLNLFDISTPGQYGITAWDWLVNGTPAAGPAVSHGIDGPVLVNLVIHDAGGLTATATRLVTPPVMACPEPPPPSGRPPTVRDSDADGISDAADNCPATPNREQADWNHNGMGDACDTPRPQEPPAKATNPATQHPSDIDADGVPDVADNCPGRSNLDQADLDSDSVGDACDADLDGDGVMEVGPVGAFLDNCPAIPNPYQDDADGDGLGDACDVDAAPHHVNVVPAVYGRAGPAVTRGTWGGLGYAAAAFAATFATALAGVAVVLARRNQRARLP
jgi:PKD repeat protein